MYNSTRLKITEETSAMLAYWDKNQVCRYMNKSASDWFGVNTEDVIDKMNMQELLGDAYSKNAPYVERVLKGETQVFERAFAAPNGKQRHALITYHPDIEHERVKGFFVHAADISATQLFHSEQIDVQPEGHEPGAVRVNDPRMLEIEAYLKSEIFNGFPGLDLIAKKFHISVSKLKRDFKTCYESTPLIYFRNEQMNYAEKHSRENKVSKKELASILNFSNPSNFSIYFKKFVDDAGRRRQQALVKQQSHELNRIFIEQTPFAISMYDKEMNYLAASKQWLIDYKLEGREIIGKSSYEIFPETTDHFKLLHRECLQGIPNHCEEFYWKKPDGSVQWLTWDMKPWYTMDKEIGGILVYTQDITEKKKTEYATLRANYILNKTSEMARIGTWERDLLTGKTTWNKVVMDILESDDLRQATLEDNLAFYREGESRDKIVAAVKESLQSGKPFDIKVEMVTAKQNIKQMRVMGMVDFKNEIPTTLLGLFMEQ